MLEKERNRGDFRRNKIKCHAEKPLFSISTLDGKSGEDPAQKRLRMTSDTSVGQVVLPDNQTKCHSKLDLESHRMLLRNDKILNQVQDDKRNGFTLIELLVVVLIIGILAAVALPQYQMAVTKSRLSVLKVMTTSIAQAEETYYLANGQYTGVFANLDLTIGTARYVGAVDFSDGQCFINASGFVLCTNEGAGVRYQVYFLHATGSNQGVRWCVAVENKNLNSIPNRVCKQETGKANPHHTDVLDSTIWEY